MSAEKERVALTLVWSLGFALCVGVAMSYLLVKTLENVPLLSWRDVLEVLPSVVAIYAAYLGAILASWFVKPFPVRGDPKRARIRFWIAALGAIAVNLSYAFWLGVGFWGDGAGLDDIIGARQIVGWLSFIVAPANIYYFGVRSVHK